MKRQQQSLKVASLRSKIDRIDDKLPSDPLPYVNQATDKRFSSWPTSLPLREQSLSLNKQEFRDSLQMRYNLPLEDLPSSCTCGSAFSVNHATSCGFVAQKNDGVRGLMTTLFAESLQQRWLTEPHMIPLDNEHVNLATNTRNLDTSGVPLLRQFGNLSIPENLVISTACAYRVRPYRLWE